MNTCKCGKTKVSITAATGGPFEIQIGCPVCKGTARASS